MRRKCINKIESSYKKADRLEKVRKYHNLAIEVRQEILPTKMIFKGLDWKKIKIFNFLKHEKNTHFFHHKYG